MGFDISHGAGAAPLPEIHTGIHAEQKFLITFNLNVSAQSLSLCADVRPGPAFSFADVHVQFCFLPFSAAQSVPISAVAMPIRLLAAADIQHAFSIIRYFHEWSCRSCDCVVATLNHSLCIHTEGVPRLPFRLDRQI